MIGRGYAIFDTAIGRCGIAWSHAGVVGVQLPEAREIDTRRRLYRLHPEARELPPPPKVGIAIEAIVATLRGQAGDFSDVTLDIEGISPFNRRVYDFVRSIPHGETRTLSRGCKRPPRLRRSAFGGSGDREESLHDHRTVSSGAGNGRQPWQWDVGLRRNDFQAPSAVDRRRAADRR
jgi:O6-methylguanine-DNA--protein-cysteine methyltransferase